MSLRGIPFDKSKFGALKFKNIVQFLAKAEQELKQGKMWPGKKEQKNIPKPKHVEIPDLFEITESNLEMACPASKLGLCVVAFFDGHPDNVATLASEVNQHFRAFVFILFYMALFNVPSSCNLIFSIPNRSRC